MKGIGINGLAQLAIASLALSGCASGSDRYPALSLRDFERVQGQFSVVDSPKHEHQPTPLSVQRAEEIAGVMESARERHMQFLAAAEQAQGFVANAAGSDSQDKNWSLAMIEIAALDSRLGASASLLADLDALYADASLAFEARTEIAAAQVEVAALVQAEREVIEGLAQQLGS